MVAVMGRRKAADPRITVGFRVRQSTLERIAALAEKRGQTATLFLAAVVEKTYSGDPS